MVAEGGEEALVENAAVELELGEKAVSDLDNPVTPDEDADRESRASGEEGEEGEERTEKPKQDEEAVQELKEELMKTRVCAPKLKIDRKFRPEDYPESYQVNTDKEEQIVDFAENFRKQYIHLYKDRTPLLLTPYNECNVQKFVSTTIRLTRLPYKSTYNWGGCANFVADHLHFDDLEPPIELPDNLVSPTTLLKERHGTSFDYSTLLCSLLLGVGYDAYVVSGYATREVCNADLSRDECPLLAKPPMKSEEAEKPPPKKYSNRISRKLTSDYEAMLKQREVDAEKNKVKGVKMQLLYEEEERFKPPPDPLFGLRIHSWVLILSGKREVPESFFVEPLTGQAMPLNTTHFHGIEAVWNHTNFWVNMQDCSTEGVAGLRFDLTNTLLWEPFIPMTDPNLLRLPQGNDGIIDGLDEDEDESVLNQPELPPSWVLAIEITPDLFEERFPNRYKVKYYKASKVEFFSPHQLRDLEGLTRKLTVYEDRECIKEVRTTEFYENRADKLTRIELDLVTGWITEHYEAGRSGNLKEHKYRLGAHQPESDRVMNFYHEARVDGLVTREEAPTMLTEHFVDRPDRLYFRQAIFGKRQKKFGPAQEFDTASLSRPVELRPLLKMTEKYNRNPDLVANTDLATVIYFVSDEKIFVQYHTEDDRVSASTREFIKPPNHDEKGAILQMQSDTHITFQVDPTNLTTKQVEIYQMLVDFLNAENVCKNKVRESEYETQDFLKTRDEEKAKLTLVISPYDTLRNNETRATRLREEKQREEERLRTAELELDYLAPFLAQVADHENITRQVAFKLKEDCLFDLKQRLIDTANMIQDRFEAETRELQASQSWYQANQLTISKEAEEQYLNKCAQAMFRIHILELRLNRHKEMAPHKYLELERKIKTDARLSQFF